MSHNQTADTGHSTTTIESDRASVAVAVCPNCGMKNLEPGHNMMTTIPTAKDEGGVAECWNCKTVVFEVKKNWRPRL